MHPSQALQSTAFLPAALFTQRCMASCRTPFQSCLNCTATRARGPEEGVLAGSLCCWAVSGGRTCGAPGCCVPPCPQLHLQCCWPCLQPRQLQTAEGPADPTVCTGGEAALLCSFERLGFIRPPGAAGSWQHGSKPHFAAWWEPHFLPAIPFNFFT